jgi:N-acyl-D-aspartate/D-glutamate deacylase
MIADANHTGQNITCDFFPYVACGVGEGIPLPRWANPLYMSTEEAHRLIRNAETRKEIKRQIGLGTRLGPEERSYEPIDSTDDVVITIFPGEPELQGKTITEIAKIKGFEDPLELFLDTVTSKERFGVLAFDVWEKDLEMLVKSPLAMIGTDSGFVDDINQPNRHPRAYGSFPKILGMYVREKKLITWEEAAMKLSTRPHSKLGITDRGIIRQGFYADLVLVDPKKVESTAEYDGIARYPQGIEYVFVNGQIVVEKSEHIGAKPGKLIRARTG